MDCHHANEHFCLRLDSKTKLGVGPCMCEWQCWIPCCGTFCPTSWCHWRNIGQEHCGATTFYSQLSCTYDLCLLTCKSKTLADKIMLWLVRWHVFFFLLARSGALEHVVSQSQSQGRAWQAAHAVRQAKAVPFRVSFAGSENGVRVAHSRWKVPRWFHFTNEATY